MMVKKYSGKVSINNNVKTIMKKYFIDDILSIFYIAIKYLRKICVKNGEKI